MSNIILTKNFVWGEPLQTGLFIAVDTTFVGGLLLNPNVLVYI